jgi:hypothetical protein
MPEDAVAFVRQILSDGSTPRKFSGSAPTPLTSPASDELGCQS